MFRPADETNKEIATMSETNTVAVVETPAAPAITPSVKKAAKKTAAPKATKKAAAPKKAEKNGKPAAKKGGLRKPQVRILRAVLKNPKGLTRSQIAEKAPVDVATCVEYVGSSDPAIRKANDVKHFPSLISLGFVKAEQHDVKGKDVVIYTITEKGKEGLKKAATE